MTASISVSQLPNLAVLAYTEGLNVLDVAAEVDAVKEVPWAEPFTRTDVFPAIPDQRLDVLDLTMVVDAVKELPYPFELPCD